MKTTAIQLRGNAGAGDLRTTTAAQVRERVLEFLNARRPAGSNLQLAIDPTALALTREYNGTWTLRFAAQVRDSEGRDLGSRYFAGRYDPEYGGIELRDQTRENFVIHYHKDTR